MKKIFNFTNFKLVGLALLVMACFETVMSVLAAVSTYVYYSEMAALYGVGVFEIISPLQFMLSCISSTLACTAFIACAIYLFRYNGKSQLLLKLSLFAMALRYVPNLIIYVTESPEEIIPIAFYALFVLCYLGMVLAVNEGYRGAKIAGYAALVLAGLGLIYNYFGSLAEFFGNFSPISSLPVMLFNFALMTFFFTVDGTAPEAEELEEAEEEIADAEDEEDIADLEALDGVEEAEEVEE